MYAAAAADVRRAREFTRFPSGTSIHLSRSYVCRSAGRLRANPVRFVQLAIHPVSIDYLPDGGAKCRKSQPRTAGASDVSASAFLYLFNNPVGARPDEENPEIKSGEGQENPCQRFRRSDEDRRANGSRTPQCPLWQPLVAATRTESGYEERSFGGTPLLLRTQSDTEVSSLAENGVGGGDRFIRSVRKSLQRRWRWLSALGFLVLSAVSEGCFRCGEKSRSNSRALGLETPCLLATPLRSSGGYNLSRTVFTLAKSLP